MNPMLPAFVQRDTLVLASASPRRAQILGMLGLSFEVVATGVEDEHAGHEVPAEHALRFARLKAAEVAASRPGAWVVGADTIVVVDGDILEKPRDADEALRMLRRLRGRWHTVYTGVAVMRGSEGPAAVGVEATAVRFRACDDAMLRAYVDAGESLDKAGAYAIQGWGALLVREIRGCFYNVMGFPVSRFVELLGQLENQEENGAG